MKKILLLSVLFVFFASAYAQNVQLHYDFGEGRNYFTSTVEMFKPDKYGSTFFFVDMDYNVGDVEGVSLAYWEIARAFKLGQKLPFAFHVEYNGGLGQWRNKKANIGGAYTINDAWLTGLEYSWNATDFSKGFTLQTLYKYIREKHDASFQLTGIWYYNFLGGKMSFTGFADFWREDNTFDKGETKKFIFLSEPQLWYNFTKHFSAGGEVELSSNFGGLEGFHAMPTVAVKYNF